MTKCHLLGKLVFLSGSGASVLLFTRLWHNAAGSAIFATLTEVVRRTQAAHFNIFLIIRPALQNGRRTLEKQKARCRFNEEENYKKKGEKGDRKASLTVSSLRHVRGISERQILCFICLQVYRI